MERDLDLEAEAYLALECFEPDLYPLLLDLEIRDLLNLEPCEYFESCMLVELVDLRFLLDPTSFDLLPTVPDDLSLSG